MTTISGQQITFEAKKQTSPFHNWLSNIAGNTAYTAGVSAPTTENGIRVTKYYLKPDPGIINSTTVNSVFLTKEINVAGNMVQFANEMNSGLNQSWVTVNLMDNIAFEIGMPVIAEFKGTFKGNNKTITFNSGTNIMGGDSANVGIFGTLTSTARVENLNVIFSGTLTAGTETDGAIDIATVKVGVIAGQNNGTLENVSLSLTQGGLITALGQTVFAGGMVGDNVGAISKSTVTIDGKFFIQGYSMYVGGVVGTSSATTTFTNINVVVRGELLALVRAGGAAVANVGGFAGRTTSATLSTNNFVITVKDVSNFKNDVLRTLNATTSKKGAIAGVGSATKALNNTWLMASYEQYMDDGENEDGEKVIRLFDGDTNVYNANRIYVNGGTVNCTMDVTVVNPVISFSVPHDTSHVFTGWFINYNCNTMVSSNYLSGSSLTNLGQMSNMVFFTAVISSMIMNYDNLNTIAITTNAGQNYSGIEFILGADITIPSAATYMPIGTITNPFRGIFDGKSLHIYIDGSISQANQAVGLFGCIGEGGVVKQLQVTLNSNIGAIGNIVSGVIAAYNYGTIGQDSSSNKIIVDINSTISGNVAGGIVGINYGIIKNAEVNYIQDPADIYVFGNVSATGLVSYEGTGANGIGGGVVGFNAEGSLVKNAIAAYDVYNNNVVEVLILAETSKGIAYAGGLVGYNSGELYSSICEIRIESEETVTAGVMFWGTGSGVSGTLVGFNSPTANIDALWALYCQDNSLALPIDALALINGKDSTKGNKLVRYGVGAINIIIEDNNITQPKGGAITFKAVSAGVAFYNYTSDILAGDIVTAANGGAGRNFSPTVATATKPGLAGVVYYGVFVNTSITSSADLYAMAANINSGFSAHANYIVTLNTSSEIKLYPSDANYATIGSDNAFVGNFNGNGYLIRLFINADFPAQNIGKALFGTIAATSAVQNFRFDVEVGIVLEQGGEIGSGVKAAGFLANINHGLINNVTLNTTARIIGTAGNGIDYVGGITGYNDGIIKSTTITYLFSNLLGIDYAGAIYGYNAGGIAGYNRGYGQVISCINNSNVKGSNYVGGIVG
ncbi:MAG: hypothetical protein EOM87_06400, partial [Clostridia bacterium]|nr:hypothetical protein [Clostridia bacterium]